MKPSLALDLNREEVKIIITSHGGLSPRVFGSVATGEDTEESDLNIVIDKVDGFSLFDLCAMINDLEALLSVKVFVCTPLSIPDRDRDEILRKSVAL